MRNKILIPLDGSETAEKVLPYSRVLAENLKAPPELVAGRGAFAPSGLSRAHSNGSPLAHLNPDSAVNPN